MIFANTISLSTRFYFELLEEMLAKEKNKRKKKKKNTVGNFANIEPLRDACHVEKMPVRAISPRTRVSLQTLASIQVS